MKKDEILILLLAGYAATNLLTIGENVNKIYTTTSLLEGLDASAQLLKALILCGLAYFLIKRKSKEERHVEEKNDQLKAESPNMRNFFIGEKEGVLKIQQSSSALISQSFIQRFSVTTRVPANTPNEYKMAPVNIREELSDTPPNIIRVQNVSNEGQIDPIYLPSPVEQHQEKEPSHSLKEQGFSMFKNEDEKEGISPGSMNKIPFVLFNPSLA